MSDVPANPHDSMGFLLHDVSRLMRRNFNRRAIGMALTQAHCRTLAHLSRNEGTNQVALAEILEIQPITLTRLIDRLEEAGLVERQRDPDDRRAQRLFLTEAAAPVMAEVWAMVAMMHEAALAGLSAGDCAHVVRALQKMKSNLLQGERDASADRQSRKLAMNAGNA